MVLVVATVVSHESLTEYLKIQKIQSVLTNFVLIFIHEGNNRNGIDENISNKFAHILFFIFVILQRAKLECLE